MDDQRASAEVVAVAVHAEREAALFYTMLADMVSEPEVAEHVRGLAADEKGHAQELVDLHVALTGSAPQPAPATPAEGDLNLLEFSTRSVRELYEHALAGELWAAATYEEQAKKAVDPGRQKMWSLLAATERGHAKYLRLQLDRLEE